MEDTFDDHLDTSYTFSEFPRLPKKVASVLAVVAGYSLSMF